MMKKKEKITGSKEKELPEYLDYPAKDDIYNKGKKEADLDPENPSRKKSPNEKLSDLNEKDFNDDKTASDLDIPGVELDDELEEIGSEDEENNYYSVGGDKHSNN
ncbi:MAG: hypothetical protein ACT4ON_05365 [Bacteroidota bacterium]